MITSDILRYSVQINDGLAQTAQIWRLIKSMGLCFARICQDRKGITENLAGEFR